MNNQELAEQILNDIEKAEVLKFIENRTMVEAVRKVLLSGVYFNGTLRAGEKAEAGRNFALALVVQKLANNEEISNELLGQDIRGAAEGIRLVEIGFSQLDKFKTTPEPKKKEKNPGR